MDRHEQGMIEEIGALLDSQRFAALATQRDGHPYTSLMAFAYTEDLKEFVVVTGKATRKYQNLIEENRVFLLIDNRSNNEDDFDAAIALTALGTAGIVDDGERSSYQRLYLARHPYLEQFLTAPSTVLVKIMVNRYLLVSRFQNVMEYRVREGYDSFGSASKIDLR
jgi:nitroimidazol reductase NimA-like FMN-containing flavoprotein (pyridoxamine 5'-phosphate oxidase superfamily)